MADRQQQQPSSSSSHHHTRNYDNSNSHKQHRPRSDRPKQFEPASKKRFNTEQRPITNTENDHGVKLMAIFCQFNPQHVVSERNRSDHEKYDCPDRLWVPGQPRLKYNDLDI